MQKPFLKRGPSRHLAFSPQSPEGSVAPTVLPAARMEALAGPRPRCEASRPEGRSLVALLALPPPASACPPRAVPKLTRPLSPFQAVASQLSSCSPCLLGVKRHHKLSLAKTHPPPLPCLLHPCDLPGRGPRRPSAWVPPFSPLHSSRRTVVQRTFSVCWGPRAPATPLILGRPWKGSCYFYPC